jgi:hypothetical protein
VVRPPGTVSNGRQQLPNVAVLEEKMRRASGTSLVVSHGVDAETDNRRIMTIASQPASHFDAVELGHLDVDHHNIRAEPTCDLNSLETTGGFANNNHVVGVIEDRTESVATYRVVVDDEDADWMHALPRV